MIMSAQTVFHVIVLTFHFLIGKLVSLVIFFLSHATHTQKSQDGNYVNYNQTIETNNIDDIENTDQPFPSLPRLWTATPPTGRACGG